MVDILSFFNQAISALEERVKIEQEKRAKGIFSQAEVPPEYVPTEDIKPPQE